jgi:hypothetical protein
MKARFAGLALTLAETIDMKWIQRSIVALLVAGALSLGLAGPAAAQPINQDGLVNVFMGDDVVAACVPITAAVRGYPEI